MGQAIVSGVLSNIVLDGDALSRNIITFPFPRMKYADYNNYDYDDLKVKYREKMVSETKIFICIFGAKLDGDVPVFAEGIEKEFMTSVRNKSFVVPIGATGFASKKVWNYVNDDLDRFYPIHNPSKEKYDVRREAFEGLCAFTDFSKKDERSLLIENITLFLSQPWNIL